MQMCQKYSKQYVNKQNGKFMVAIVNYELKDKNNNILFHCRSSVNRSPTMVVAMLMKYKNWTLKEAHTLVSEKHSLTCTHYKYMEQLRQYDKELFGKYSTKIGELDT
eukprot:360145_1